MAKKSSFAPVIIVIALSLAVLLVKTCQRKGTAPPRPNSNTTEKRGLDRDPAVINYSQHAKCRMECRHIDEAEVKAILKEGTINYKKSDLDGTECKKRYAVEGKTRDGQSVRIIFAPCQAEVTVVTVIDLGEEWPCNCGAG